MFHFVAFRFFFSATFWELFDDVLVKVFSSKFRGFTSSMSIKYSIVSQSRTEKERMTWGKLNGKRKEDNGDPGEKTAYTLSKQRERTTKRHKLRKADRKMGRKVKETRTIRSGAWIVSYQFQKIFGQMQFIECCWINLPIAGSTHLALTLTPYVQPWTQSKP